MPELNETQFKQPHQMSPDEFALHPNAVFHGTWLPDNEIFNMAKRRPQSGYGYPMTPVAKIHLGTFAAAVHRLHDTRIYGNQKPANIHTFWQTPHVSDFGGAIRALDNAPEDMAHFLPGPMWYNNQHEDDQNPSFATEEPHHYLKSQADYVQAAIASGKGKEVHPETMKRYQAGTLGKMRLNKGNLETLYQNLYQPNPAIGRNALGPYEHAGPSWETLKEKGLFELSDPSYEYDKGEWTV
jgi:hypothetical protein